MVASSTGHEYHAARATNDGKVGSEPTQSDLVFIEIDTSTHSVDDGLRLFVNFLLHESIEFTLHDSGNLELECLDRPGGSGLTSGLFALILTSQTMDMELAIGNVGDIVIFKVQNPLRVLNDGGSIRSDEEFNRLGKAIFRHESARLCSENLGIRCGDAK